MEGLRYSVILVILAQCSLIAMSVIFSTRGVGEVEMRNEKGIHEELSCKDKRNRVFSKENRGK